MLLFCEALFSNAMHDLLLTAREMVQAFRSLLFRTQDYVEGWICKRLSAELGRSKTRGSGFLAPLGLEAAKLGLDLPGRYPRHDQKRLPGCDKHSMAAIRPHSTSKEWSVETSLKRRSSRVPAPVLTRYL